MIDNIRVLESVITYSCDPANPPYVQNGRVSVKMTLNDFSSALISSGITTSRRAILPLYDWVSSTYGVVISPRKFSNGTYTNKASFALDIFKALKAIDAENSPRPDVRAALEHYSNIGISGMDPTAVIDACLHNLALIRSKITALGACAPTSALAEGKELIRDSLRGCLDLMEAD